ncbi:VWA domain-containing protein [Raoultella terrigena]|jgi:Ca-activated chloride channel family protein|uniref:VWA domain-containing protein n=1 Tax=Raoultella terrigena TaxID=577 RepID=UPI000977FAA6|nr:VWA domain-containing protein [Raoultella terrigena]MCE9900452.1 VWA domain-containing protein [Raoultella terrigena]MEB8196017.1 VWA domain-containing protein [Raoultella terrigena]NWK88353.1 VWA domain-containing protein [Raoultella terrigena]OMP93092.1 VWA domain-containing protein [Raoultella terrigena]SUQ56058.1 Mg-chelatase subunit ChlD [Raoultella terrigena]
MSEWLTRIDFAWPWAGLLLLLPLVTRYLPQPGKTVPEQVRVPFLPSLIDALKLDARPERGSRRGALLFWLIWSLLICALARPEYLTPPQYITRPMRDIVLIIDVSGSMGKTDVEGGITRQQAVQDSLRKFVASRRSDRIGMVIFATKAWPFAPISEDKQALQTRINQLAPGMIGQQTAIGDALGVAVKVLDAGPDSRADKLAILLTDGNDTASQLPPMLAAKLAAEHHVQVHTIAFGDPNSRDNDKVDLALLQRIAKTTGGHAWTAARSGSALDEVWQKIDAITPVQVKSLGWSWHKALYPWPLSTALLLLLTLAVGRYVREKMA